MRHQWSSKIDDFHLESYRKVSKSTLGRPAAYMHRNLLHFDFSSFTPRKYLTSEKWHKNFRTDNIATNTCTNVYHFRLLFIRPYVMRLCLVLFFSQRNHSKFVAYCFQIKDGTWHKTILEVNTSKTHRLPIHDVAVYDIGDTGEEFGLEIGPVLFLVMLVTSAQTRRD